MKATKAVSIALDKMCAFFYSNIDYILNEDNGISWDAICDELGDQDIIDCVSSKLARKHIKEAILKSKWAQKALKDLADDATEEFYTYIQTSKENIIEYEEIAKKRVERALLADSLTKQQKQQLWDLHNLKIE